MGKSVQACSNGWLEHRFPIDFLINAVNVLGFDLPIGLMVDLLAPNLGAARWFVDSEDHEAEFDLLATPGWLGCHAISRRHSWIAVKFILDFWKFHVSSCIHMNVYMFNMYNYACIHIHMISYDCV